LATIGDEAFKNCTSLLGLAFNEKLASIGDRAFMDCTSLEYAYIWYDTQIGSQAFANDDLLTIYTLAGSDAYRYAREDGINYSAYVDEDSFYDEWAIKLDSLAGYLGYCSDGHGDIQWLTVYDADCENDGYMIGVCEYCSEILDEKHINATGHNYVQTANIPATETTRGMVVFTCQNCGTSYCDYIEPLSDDYVVENHTVTARVVIATDKTATTGKAPAKNVGVVIDGITVAKTDNNGYFTCELESGVYEAQLTYSYGFNRTIYIIVEDKDIVYDEPIAIIGCDFTRDGVINDKDLEIFQMVVSSSKNDASYLDFVDIDNNGYINAKDRAYITSCRGINVKTFKYDEIIIQKQQPVVGDNILDVAD
jgi:hypothetical protein